ncbi:MAG: hypothetical protein GVY13_11750 [Alphaproteobacteria bacterium]|jgi:signal transduction histidine kinase|nr:hypothetical protein [Alphaproteobacteria bacterium]
MGSDQRTLEEAGIDLALLSNFVHQVVNPLNGVAGTLDNLSEGAIVEPHRRQQRLRAARAQLEQCITLIRNLAFLSQGFRPMTQNEKRITVLPQVIIESAMFYQEDGKSKNVEIELKDRETQNRVLGHHELIRQLVMNILDNCIKYGEASTTVEIEQWVQSKTNNAMIRIRGRSKYPISHQDMEHICELGFRGDNARQMVSSGTGLGLYICKRIVEDVHNGTFSIQPFMQNGIEFLIRLPHGEAG